LIDTVSAGVLTGIFDRGRVLREHVGEPVSLSDLGIRLRVADQQQAIAPVEGDGNPFTRLE